ncbi:barstar family protein [Dactylosporangium sp. NPDC000555]|uniref:barstar family protein n=1 Tax=Dactylosporangium sp. NPDC000555 TaxID=3154260 RepID=UPI00331A082D
MTTSAGSEAGPPPERRWTWEHPVGPRWLLLGDVGFERSYEVDIPLTLCAEIEGLFVDLPPRPRERFTLVGCAPDGALAGLLDRLPAEALGTERAWLGDLSITAPPPPPGTPPSWWGEDLGDIVVLAQRPNRTMPQTVDIDLDGFVLAHQSGAPDQPAGTTYDLDGRFVTDIEGFYCAIGEAINGPGGYFGWNLNALDDCLRGSFGARHRSG